MATKIYPSRYLQSAAAFIAAFVCLCLASMCCGDDIWASGYALPVWQKIDAIQQYPGIDSPTAPDLAAACEDPHPLVRTAACMAIGRTGSEKYLHCLVPLLDDLSPLVRRNALKALTHIESPQIKQPLLEVIANWEKLDISLLYRPMLRLGLPDWLLDTNTSVTERREWVKQFDADSWKISFAREYAFDDGHTTKWIGMSTTEFDADQNVAVRLKLSRHGGTRSQVAQFGSRVGSLSGINERGEAVDDTFESRLTLADGRDLRDLEFELPPDGNLELEFKAADWVQPLCPGFYLFQALDADWPLLVRVRRSEESEREIAQLIERLPGTERQLGQQRARAAAAPIADFFVADSGIHPFEAAEALARIGDPVAIPALLQHTELSHMDVGGDTRRYLAAFGEQAWPHYERQILQWENLLATGRTSTLEMSLRMLGPNGSEHVDRERLQLLQSLAKQGVEGDWSRGAVVSASIEGAAERHTSTVVDLIWDARQQRDLFRAMLQPFERQGGAKSTASVVDGLWRKAQTSNDGTVPHAVLSLALRYMPERALKDHSKITTASEAALVLDYGSRHESAMDNTVRRLAHYLESHKDSHIQVGLGLLRLSRGEDVEAERLLKAGLKDDELGKRDRMQAIYSLGEIYEKRGDADAARREFERALAMAEPGHHFAIETGVSEDRIRRQLDRVNVMADGVTPNVHRMASSPDENARVELREGYAYYLDRKRRLLRWDPEEQKETSFGIMPNPVRQFIPATRDGVFVLFTDGSSRYFELGHDRALWDGPDAIGFQSYLTASPNVITVASDRGVLYALATSDGRVLWTHRFEVRRQYPYHTRTWSGQTLQAGPFLLIPNEMSAPQKFTLLQLSDGTPQHHLALPFTSSNVCVQGNRVYFTGFRGQLLAVRLQDGKVVWQTQPEETNLHTKFATDVASAVGSPIVYFSFDSSMWARESESGRILWNWEWSPARQEPGVESAHVKSSTLMPLENGVVWVVDWMAEADHWQRDIVVFSISGDVRFHRTTLNKPSQNALQWDGFTRDGRVFIGHGATWELWELPREK